MEDSLFTKIIKNEIPAHKIYEDDKTLAFLDVHPAQPGHTLVIPKIQIDQLWDLPPDYYQAVMATSQKVALRLREVLGTQRVGVQVIGVHVPHAHVQLIPFNTAPEFYVQPEMTTEPNDTALKLLAEKLKF